MLSEHCLLELKSHWVKRLLDSKACIEAAPCYDENFEDNLEALRALVKIEELFDHIEEWHDEKMKEHSHKMGYEQKMEYHAPTATPSPKPMQV